MMANCADNQKIDADDARREAISQAIARCENAGPDIAPRTINAKSVEVVDSGLEQIEAYHEPKLPGGFD